MNEVQYQEGQASGGPRVPDQAYHGDTQNAYPLQEKPQYRSSEDTYTQDAPQYGVPANHSEVNGNPPEYKNEQSQPNKDSGVTFEEQFKVSKPKWNDWWAVVFLGLVVAAFVIVSGICIHAYHQTKSFNGNGIYGSGQTYSLNTNTVILFIFVVVISLALSVGYFYLARVYTKQFIWITGILNIVLGFATAIYYFAEHYYSAAIVFLIFAVFGAFCFYSWIGRIPFATLILQTIMDVARANPSIYIVAAIGAVVTAAFGAWFAVTIVAVYVKYNPTENNEGCDASGGSCSHAKLIGMLILVTFCGYYITEVIKNIIHTTISGVYGSWYFCSRSAQGMPKWPALGAFKRAMTYSLGSISFGSLIVSVIQLLQQLASWGQQAAHQDGHIVAVALMCVLRFLISALEWAVRYFNHYAYSYIALYGDAYIPAAKETWRLIKDRGVDALINDCLIDPVLNMGATFVAYVAALFAYLYLRYTQPAYNSSGSYNGPVVAYSFVIALQICNIATVPIKSGVATFFTAMARDPEVLQMRYPDLYNNIMRLYPKVQQRIHA
ncbi:plasma-membrane choline transporter-domain-containing protein [Dipodascopsis tothii]|uniref:plasma-membrane choline transporter-domain-containing protein n=1 Tax=Dipodascopsis tothii TaxID=44089 RepID=UPI0034CE344C